MQKHRGAAALALAFPFLFQVPAPTPKEPSRPLARIAVVGASLSAGYGNFLPLHLVFRKTLDQKKTRIEDTATSLFFMQPLATGKFQVDKVLEFKPTLVAGLDFLFWYLYGEIPGKTRLERLEKGLHQLERLGKVPVVLGDIPDMHGASPNMLPPSSIPRAETIRKANERIHQWAKKHSNILLFPLADFTAKAKTQGWILKPDPGEKPSFSPVRLEANQLLQKDRLHPSRAGTWLLGRILFRTLRKAFPGLEKKNPPSIPATFILKELEGGKGKGRGKKEKKAPSPARAGKG